MLAIGACVVLAGCSGGNGQSDAGPDDAVINGCTVFNDLTAGGGTINFPDTATPAAIEPSCAKIKVGQTLTFAGDFAAHPLVPEGGDSPNPIPATSSGTNKIVSFPSAGTFGFGCSVHATMRGAILVVTQ